MGFLYMMKNKSNDKSSEFIFIQYIVFTILFVSSIALTAFQNSEVNALMKICYNFNVPTHVISMRTGISESNIIDTYTDFKVQAYRRELDTKKDCKKVQAKK